MSAGPIVQITLRHHWRLGAWLIRAPSCTDTIAGFNRVRIAAAARAMENQCFVGMAPTVGLAPWIGTLDVGSALSWGSLALFPLMGFFLMAPVAAGFSGLFADPSAKSATYDIDGYRVERSENSGVTAIRISQVN